MTTNIFEVQKVLINSASLIYANGRGEVTVDAAILKAAEIMNKTGKFLKDHRPFSLNDVPTTVVPRLENL